MISTILSILSAALMIYTIMCFINILMSWIPGLKFTAFGRFISSATDPYLNFFSKKGLFRIGMIDFSPIISLGILSLASSILGGIQSSGVIHFGGILATIIVNLWGIASSLLGILFLLVLIRWIVLMANKGVTDYNSGWNKLDQMLNKFTYKIAGTFVKCGMNYQKSLLVTWIALLVVLIAGHFIFNELAYLCSLIPF